MNYFQWFIKDGWKGYSIPFGIIAVVDYGVYKDWDFIISVPLFGLILESIPILGANIGIIGHSIWTWNKNK